MIGARNIYESVRKKESLLANHNDNVEMVFNFKGLVKSIVGFLECSKLKMKLDKRHETAKGLISLSFIEMMMATTVSYNLLNMKDEFKSSTMVEMKNEKISL